MAAMKAKKAVQPHHGSGVTASMAAQNTPQHGVVNAQHSTSNAQVQAECRTTNHEHLFLTADESFFAPFDMLRATKDAAQMNADTDRIFNTKQRC
jgi:hypothetical protein